MALLSIPAFFMRGGTSNALVFAQADLPDSRADWDAIFLAAMGSPDGFGRQLDGMGGGVSSLSKVCVLSPPSRADADVDFTFAQIAVGEARVDYAGNCGNMISAVGPAALELGLVTVPNGSDASIRIHNTNTAKIIVSSFPVCDGKLKPQGDLHIDGVSGGAAPIKLDFLEPGGARTGALLPTGSAIDMLDFGGSQIRASLIDAANPCVFVAASDLALAATEHPDELGAHAVFLQKMEAIRQAGAVRMGMAKSLTAAAQMPSVPKVAIVGPPAQASTLSGSTVGRADMSLTVRMLSMELPHRAVPVTGAICLALAARVPGTIPHQLCRKGTGAMVIAHPSGTILVDAAVETRAGQIHAISGTVFRTARMLFSGQVHYRLA
ncbi:MAG: PrpF family protein [Rhodobacteraceae bacterium]|nr:PrpF family protein [Paracoccaceae bacterium]